MAWYSFEALFFLGRRYLIGKLQPEHILIKRILRDKYQWAIDAKVALNRNSATFCISLFM